MEVNKNLSRRGVDLNACAYCSTEIDEYSRTSDHLTPKSRGGILSNKNKVPSCRKCNELKGDMDIHEFKRALESMIYLESKTHKEKMGYLKKVKINVTEIINNIKYGRKG